MTIYLFQKDAKVFFFFLQRLDHILHCGRPLNVVLVSQNEDGDSSELGLVKEVFQLSAGSLELLVISRIHHKPLMLTECMHDEKKEQ